MTALLEIIQSISDIHVFESRNINESVELRTIQDETVFVALDSDRKGIDKIRLFLDQLNFAFTD